MRSLPNTGSPGAGAAGDGYSTLRKRRSAHDAARIVKMAAGDVRIGDILTWCGLACEVVDEKSYRPDGRARRRPGRYLIVADPVSGEDRQLHYYDDETVEIDWPPAVESPLRDKASPVLDEPEPTD